MLCELSIVMNKNKNGLFAYLTHGLMINTLLGEVHSPFLLFVKTVLN
jgi:hypothetical protein